MILVFVVCYQGKTVLSSRGGNRLNGIQIILKVTETSFSNNTWLKMSRRIDPLMYKPQLSCKLEYIKKYLQFNSDNAHPALCFHCSRFRCFQLFVIISFMMKWLSWILVSFCQCTRTVFTYFIFGQRFNQLALGFPTSGSSPVNSDFI